MAKKLPLLIWWTVPTLLNAIVEKQKHQSKDDFEGRHFEAWLIEQAMTWYLRYRLSHRDLEDRLCPRLDGQ